MMPKMQWKSWLMVPMALLVGVSSCARKPEKSESAPVAPAATPTMDERAQPEPAAEAEQAPTEKDEEREYAPAPAPGAVDKSDDQAQKAAEQPQLAPKAKRKASAKSGAPLEPAKPRARGPVDSLGPDVSSLSIEQAERELETTFTRLGQELRLSSPDCPSAQQFVGRVCELAEHICRLAEENDEPQQLATCVDGRNRCAESRRRYAAKCAE